MATTHTLFTLKDVDIQYNDDQYAVVATADIPVGTLVLLEHVIWNTKYEPLLAALEIDKDLYNTLYPRLTSDEAFPDKAMDKIQFNAFRFYEDEFVIGSLVSKFNHSCKPNCHMGIADHIEGAKIYGIWVHRKITTGQQLTLDYVNCGDIKFHNSMLAQHGIQSCGCTDEYILKNANRSEIHMNMSSAFCEKEKARISNMVDAYVSSGKYKATLKTQSMAVNNASRFLLQDEEDA